MSDKIVGKTAAAPGEESQPYKKNEGSAGNKRIVFIGASYLFVHKVLRDMCLVGGFEDVELVVHDLDEVPMNIVADLLERIARQQDTNIKVHRTLDRAEALKGADAAVLSITTGGREADQRSWEVCSKYGIPVAVGDTMGPAALARNLREVPIVVEIVRDMERYCPEAVMLNFTNPMSAITGAMARETSITAWGLCHSADSLFKLFADTFGVEKTDIDMEVGGVNHQAFVTKLIVKGEDRTKDILQATIDADTKFEDVLLESHKEDVDLQQAIFRMLGAWPSTGHTHLAEFYEYFMTERRIEELGGPSCLRGQVIPGRERFGRKKCPDIIHEWTYGEEPVGDLHLLTTEHSHELLWSCFTGEPYTRVLNILNEGEYIKNLPRTACVEALVTVEGRKVTGRQIELPTAVHSIVERWCAIHDLSIRAALECDRDLARQALFLDPHVADCFDIEPMLEDMLKALDEWMPRGWFK